MKSKVIVFGLGLLVLVAVVAGCGGDDDDATDVVTPSPTLTAEISGPSPTPRRESTRTPVPGATSTPTPTRTPPAATPTPTPTVTPAPTPTPTLTPTPTPNAVARAGPDRDAAVGAAVTLNGSASSDPDGDPVSLTWAQVYGQDVTDGVGFFRGATPSFTAPDSVGTVILELRVNDGHGDGAPDRVQINVMEHVETALFVDGDNGSNETGDGSRDNPFASISFAINRIQGPDFGIYVMSRANGAAYAEAETLRPPTTTSLYGGFGPDWVRNVVDNRTRLDGAPIAVDLGPVNVDAWFSGFDLTAANASRPVPVYSYSWRTQGAQRCTSRTTP